ncbi:hypothetical protein ABZZ79_02970 [Streptomyces sp. NPDC006458]|uniref:hypothetical protein n=1 Tax=Streptomyces sp. NPDC006458 TaxID=3154302 RepID=UPI0033AEB033
MTRPAPSPDIKAVLRAAQALTEQVRRVADALTRPVTTADDIAQEPASCPVCGRAHPGEDYCTEPAPPSLAEQVAEAIEYTLLPDIANRGVRQATARRAANNVMDVVLPTTRVTAALHRSAEEDLARVIAVYERWKQAGPPPIGTSLSCWWDERLAELHIAVHPPADESDTP